MSFRRSRTDGDASRRRRRRYSSSSSDSTTNDTTHHARGNNVADLAGQILGSLLSPRNGAGAGPSNTHGDRDAGRRPHNNRSNTLDVSNLRDNVMNLAGGLNRSGTLGRAREVVSNLLGRRERRVRRARENNRRGRDQNQNQNSLRDDLVRRDQHRRSDRAGDNSRRRGRQQNPLEEITDLARRARPFADRLGEFFTDNGGGVGRVSRDDRTGDLRRHNTTGGHGRDRVYRDSDYSPPGGRRDRVYTPPPHFSREYTPEPLTPHRGGGGRGGRGRVYEDSDDYYDSDSDSGYELEGGGEFGARHGRGRRL
jgi:hypothetical protein